MEALGLCGSASGPCSLAACDCRPCGCNKRSTLVVKTAVAPQSHGNNDGFGDPKPVSGQLPDCRRGLSRWRGGRYRVVNQESSGTADIVWVIGKGDSCDPFTQDDAGGTPASQLLCHHRAQLPAGGKRFCQAFWQ